MKASQSLNILNTLRVTPSEISRETRKKFKLAVVGSADMVSPFYEALTQSVNLDGGTGDRLSLDDLLEVCPLPMDETRRRDLKADAIIFLLSHKDADRDNLLIYRDLFKLKPPAHLFIEDPSDMTEQERLYQLMDELNLSGREWIEPPSVDAIRDKAEVLLSINPLIDAAMAYRFPILRDAMARMLIHKTGIQNMIIALASSLPSNIPIIGIIIGLLGAAGETTVLTMNQLKLCLQLAGIYGLKLNLADRVRELWPLVGTAFGFRTIARTLVGFIPIAGPSIKGAIAYAGTHLVGETSRWYYEEGRRLTPGEKKRIYKKALEEAKKTAIEYFEQLTATVSDRTGQDRQEIAPELDSLSKDLHLLDSEISGLKTMQKETREALTPEPETPEETEQEKSSKDKDSTAEKPPLTPAPADDMKKNSADTNSKDEVLGSNGKENKQEKNA